MSPIRTLALLVGCTAAAACSSANLPESQKLSTDQVAEFASRIEAKYPELSQGKRDEVLRTVVRSLDEMVFIEGGTFEMGDFGWKCDFDPAEVCSWPCGAPEDNLCNITRDTEDRPRKVGLSSYHLAAKKTTLGDFDLYLSVFGKEPVLSELRHREDLQHLFDPMNSAPVKRWDETKTYCQWLGELSGYPIDLPTEAQWEYAARDRGKNILYPTNDGSLKLGKNFPYDEEKVQITSRVDAFAPNPLGLFLMSGGATEFVNDWYSESYYAESANQLDPKGPETGEEKVARGTDMVDTPWLTANTVLRRNEALAFETYYQTNSFRCAMNIDKAL